MDRLVELFALNIPAWELAVRGSAMYLMLFAFFRFVMRRDVGAVGVADLLILVLIADVRRTRWPASTRLFRRAQSWWER